MMLLLLFPLKDLTISLNSTQAESDHSEIQLETRANPNSVIFFHCKKFNLFHLDGVPGPGAYRIPSDFGYYESKHSKTHVDISIAKSPERTRNAETLPDEN